MAGIQLDERRIDVTGGGSMIRRFSVDLPDIGGQIAASANRLGGAIMQAGEERDRANAQKVARETANATQVTRDANGNFVRPPTPETFGPYAAAIFDEAIDTRYVNEVYLQTQVGLNNIAAKNINDPDAYMNESTAMISGVLQGVDPRYAGVIAPRLRGEQVERQRGLVYDEARRNRELEGTRLTEQLQDIDQQILDAGAQGFTEKVEELMVLRDQTQQQRINLGLEPNDPAMMERDRLGLRSAGSLIGLINSGLSAGTLNPAELASVAQALQGWAVPGENSFGITPEWVARNIPNAKTRAALATMVTKLEAELTQQLKAESDDIRYNQIVGAYEGGFRGEMPGQSPEEREKVLGLWAQKTGTVLMSPEGIEKAWMQFGMLPEKSIKSMFANIKGFAPDQIEARYQTYFKLQNLPTQDRSGRMDMTAILSDEDQAFMEIYAGQREGGYDATAATTNARKLISESEGKVKREDRSSNLLGRYRETYSNPQATSTDMERSFAGALGDVGVDVDAFSQLPADAKRAFRTSVETQVAYGVPIDKAMASAAFRFKRTWKPDPMIAGGWGRAEGGYTVPAVVGLNGESSTEWVNDYMQELLDPTGMAETMRQIEADKVQRDFSGGGTIPAREADIAEENTRARNRPFMPELYVGGMRVPPESRLGAEVKLMPLGNGQFTMIYNRPDDPNGTYPITDRVGKPVIINLDRVGRKQDAISRARMVEYAAKKREWEAEQLATAALDDEGIPGTPGYGGTTSSTPPPEEPGTGAQDIDVRDLFDDVVIGPQASKIISKDRQTYSTVGLSGGQRVFAEIMNTQTVLPDGTTGSLPALQAAVLAGNIGAETVGWNPASYNPRDMDSQGNALPSHGYIQWRYPTRVAKLQAEVPDWKTNGPGQIGFALKELREDYPGVYKEFMEATTFEGAQAAMKKYIGYGTATDNKRINTARRLYEWNTGSNQRGTEMADQSGAPAEGSPISPTGAGEMVGSVMQHVNLTDVTPEVQDFAEGIMEMYPVIINSGHRSHAHNKKVRGAKGSAHLSGKAIDMKLTNLDGPMRAAMLARVLEDPRVTSIGYYPESDAMHVTILGTNGVWAWSNKSSGHGVSPATVAAYKDLTRKDRADAARRMGSLKKAPDWFTSQVIPWLEKQGAQ